MVEARIHLLGSPQIVCGGAPRSIGRRSAIALLAYLAVTGRRQARESLVALLWPEAESAPGHAYLRNALWVLKRAGLGRWLAADHDAIELCADGRLWIDLAAFRSALREAREEGAGAVREGHLPDALVRPLAGAVDLYRGDFLDGFHLGDNLVFDEWQMRQQEMLRDELSWALEKLTAHHRSRVSHGAAVTYAQRQWDLDPFNEQVLRELMELLARAGRRRAALRLFDRAARVFEDELGLRPAASTRAVRERIRSGDYTQPHPARPLLGSERGLPAQTTPFVGRARELRDIRRRLQRPGERLLTVVGMGGAGKTRLALEAASSLDELFPDGIFFVPLAAVNDVAFLVPAVIESMRAPLPAGGGGSAPAERADARRRLAQLVDYLREKRLLLILDNMEQLLEGVWLPAELLRAAPGLKLLVTSRERLAIPGERVLELDGLAWPPPSVSARESLDYDAVKLLVQSLERVTGRGSPGDHDLTAVGEICRLVEGHPLAIELAASWGRVLPPPEMAEEIAASLDVLTSRRRGGPARHRSMRAVFEHSWILLDSRERVCYRRLAVMQGSFDRAAAREVAAADLDLLRRLVEKSLLRAPSPGRFDLHELLRQYAAEKLGASRRERDRAHRRHSAHYLRLLERCAPVLEGRGQEAALDQLAQESENLRAAWLWAARAGDARRMRRAAVALFLFYDISSRFHEGGEVFGASARWMARARARPQQILRGFLWSGQGWFLRSTSPLESRRLLRRGHALLARWGPTPELALAKILGVIERIWQTPGRAAREAQNALALFRAAGDSWGEAMALEILAVATLRTETELALPRAQRCLALRRRAGDRWGVALALHLLGHIAEQEGADDVAGRRYEQSMRIREAMGQDVDGLTQCLEALARIERRRGRFEEALGRLEQWQSLSRNLGGRLRHARALTEIGLVEYDLGRYPDARAHLEEARRLCEELDDEGGLAKVHALLGNTALLSGDTALARVHLHQEAPPDQGRPGQGLPGRRWLWIGQARLAQCEGRRADAAAHLGQALEECRAERDWATAAEALLEVAALRVRMAQPERATTLLDRLLGDPAPLGAHRRAAAQEVRAAITPRPDGQAGGAMRDREAPGSWDELLDGQIADLR